MNWKPVGHEQIYQFMVQHEIHFINVFDYYAGNYKVKPDFLHFHPVLNQSGSIRSLIAWTDRKSYYFYTDPLDLEFLSGFLESRSGRIFSIYGELPFLKEIRKRMKRNTEAYHEYFVMELQSHSIQVKVPGQDYRCIPCTSKDFNRLARLQEYYHLEEVYEDRESYPYEIEMSSFRELLDERINYAVFHHGQAVSKANVNGESPRYYQLGGIFTLKEYRNQGMSGLCLSHLLRHCFKDGKNAALYVKQHNKPAYSLYQKLGFKPVLQTGICYY